jgi:transposase
MTAKELDRLRVVQLVLERRMTRVKAGGLLGIGARQLIRLCGAYKRDGAAGLVSRKRGRVGNRKVPLAVEAQIVELSRRFYQQMGPTLVRDKLAERHGIKLAKETIRKILSRAGLWSASRGLTGKRRSPTRARSYQNHQPESPGRRFGAGRATVGSVVSPAL